MTDNNETANQRECTRVPRDVHIEIKKLEYPLTRTEPDKGITLNIAERGICFTATNEYAEGDILSLDMTLIGWNRHRKSLSSMLSDDTSKTDLLTVVAEVIWCKPASDGGFEIGVKFTNIYEDDMTALEKYFANLTSE